MVNVEFRGREAYPHIICAGVKDEFGIEKVKFWTPVSGIARINLTYKNGDVDIIDLDEFGVWSIEGSVTQHPGETKAYLTVTDGHGRYMWRSREFTVLIYELDDIDDAIEQQYPSAIEKALAEIEQMREDCQYYAERAAEVWKNMMYLDDEGYLVIEYGDGGDTDG